MSSWAGRRSRWCEAASRGSNPPYTTPCRPTKAGSRLNPRTRPWRRARCYRRTIIAPQETVMSKSMKSIVATFSLWSLALAQPPLHAQEEGATRAKTPHGDLAMELVGQVLNVPMTPISNQYGYLSFLDGVDPVFTSTPHDETTARFSFTTAATTTQVINNGQLRIVDRTGSTTIYLDDVPNGDFAV